MTGYFEKLRGAATARDSVICIGLDPEPDRINGGAAGAARFCIDVVKRTSEVACAYKPNTAFWEQYGPDGWKALIDVRNAVPRDIPVLIDAKRGDVPQTMRAYARALYDVLEADAVTVHAYQGTDSLEPFAERAEKGVYVVCRTSNPSASELQDIDVAGQPLYMRVGRLAESVNVHGNVGLVLGTTAPEEVARVRAAFPRLPFLLPGVGAQGGDVERSLEAGWNGDLAGCLVSASRSVLYADDPAQAAAAVRDQVREVVLSFG